MKTIFHVGHSKAGSTALQAALLAGQESLLNKGVLYPSTPGGVYNNHKVLSADLMQPEKVPRHILKNFAIEDLPRARRELQEGIAAEVKAHKPECLVMSSESRFGALPRPGRREFRDILRGFGSDDIDIVAYIRMPSSWFLSVLNQMTRRAVKFKQPKGLNVKNSANQFREDYGLEHVHLRPFDREALRGGDVVEDFCHHFLSDYGVTVDMLEGSHVANQGFSNEGMDIVRRYRAHFLPDQDNRFVPEGEQLIKWVIRTEKDLNLPKPKLVAGLADKIDYGNRMLLELRDIYGLVMPGYDYERAEKSPETTPIPTARRLEDVVEIDREAQLELIAHTARQPWVAANIERAEWFAQLPAQIRADTGAARVYQAVSMHSVPPVDPTSKGEHLPMADKSQTTRSPQEQADRDLATSIGRAIFRVAHKDMADDVRKSTWQAERKDYVQQGRAVLKRLRKEGITLSK